MRGRGLFLWPAITRRACLIVDTCRTCCLRLFRCPVVGLICCWVRCRCTAIRFATCWLIDIKCRWPLSVCGRCWSSFVLAVSPAIWCPLLAYQHVRFHHLLDSHGFLFLWPAIARSFSSPSGQSWLFVLVACYCTFVFITVWTVMVGVLWSAFWVGDPTLSRVRN